MSWLAQRLPWPYLGAVNFLTEDPVMHNMMTTDEAAKFLGVARSTLEKARVAGTGCRFAKIGRAVRYRRADLEEYLAECIVHSTSEVGCPNACQSQSTK
jgi:excisionase family DNA binding protein